MIITDFVNGMIARLSRWALRGIQGRMHDRPFMAREIVRWRDSPRRMMQIKGSLYYDNEHDILARQRTMIGDDGKLQVVYNLPNNRVIDNQYAKLVNQKANYLLGQPFAVDCENEQYAELLNEVFDAGFMRMLKSAGKAALNSGIAWLHPYYNADGDLAFRLFPGYEILPFWKDSEHTELEYAARLYLTIGYEGSEPKTIQNVEIYDLDGIHRYILDGYTLIPDVVNQENPDASYVTITDEQGNQAALNWSRIPLIPIKYNEQETPLLKKVKSLQDGINAMLSDFENNMQEDARNTILVIKNYGGTNLGEFRRNLATFGAVNVRYDGETEGGVESLEVNVNAENYKAIVEVFKKALIENGMGFDAKDDRLSGNPNQMNIQSMYSDIDLDANEMETELQAAFREILWFVNAHLANTGRGAYDGKDVTIIFNRDMMMNEGDVINNVQKSVGVLSKRTLIANHPWVDDVDLELERLEEEEQQEQEKMQREYNPFSGQQDPKQEGQGGDMNGEEE